MNGKWEFIKWFLATFGAPAGIAVYFMAKDWFFSTDLTKLLTIQTELLRELTRFHQ